jgi:hypothetical protein
MKRRSIVLLTYPAIFLLLAIISGCVDLKVNRTLSFKEDGSGICTYDLLAPSIPLVQGAFSDIRSKLPSFCTSNINNQNDGLHLTFSYEFSNFSNLSSREKLVASSNGVTETSQSFMLKDIGQLLKREVHYSGTVIPAAGYTKSDYGSHQFLDCTVVMPGRIISSNADKVDGNTASWAISFLRGSELRYYPKRELKTASRVTVPINVKLNMIQAPLGSIQAMIQIYINESIFDTSPWAREDTDKFLALLEKHFRDFSAKREKLSFWEVGEQTYGGPGLRAKGSFSSLKAFVNHFKLSSSRFCNVLITEKGNIFKPRRLVRVTLIPIMEGYLKDILYGGEVQIELPGNVLSSNASNKNSSESQKLNILKWYASFEENQPIEFEYTYYNWMAIVPAFLLLIFIPLAFFCHNRLNPL